MAEPRPRRTVLGFFLLGSELSVYSRHCTKGMAFDYDRMVNVCYVLSFRDLHESNE